MKREAWISLAAAFFLIGILIPSNICRHAFEKYGIAIPECPDGDVRQTAELQLAGLRRGAEGYVYLGAIAHYTTDEADLDRTAPVPRFSSITTTLVDAKQKATPLAIDWERSGDQQRGTLKLPDVPDGDYKLHVAYETRLGKGELDAPLPLYTPARIHVITDRPLYEPGNVVKFRAVVLRARDLAPIDGRPGMWTIKDPSGEVLLEEKAPAGDWGVVAGSFPLDKGAATGTWHVAWVSADAVDEVAFTVEPFTLPRFRVEATAGRAFYRPGDAPAIQGSVVYSSGAPVARANLEIQWEVAGAWPPPTEWQDRLLPKQAVTGANGRFELALPKVPDDLQGSVTLTARISAIDPAGDRVAGAAQVLLAQDGIAATAVTELGNGLVQSFNNRLFVRVTTPDGRVVGKQKIKVKRTWQPGDPGVEAELDEDGVASLQIDPGAPVNIVIPALPFRPAPRAALVTRGEAEELIGDEGAPLADQVELDRWLPALAPCAKWVGDATSSTVGLRVDARGTIVTAGGGTTALDRCVVGIVRGKRLPAGSERLYKIEFQLTDPDLPTLVPSIESALDVPPGFAAEIAERARGARDCLPTIDGDLPQLLAWRVRAGDKVVELAGWANDPKAERPAASAMACVQSRLGGRVELADKATADALGFVRFSLELPARLAQQKPQPTTMLGYELDVETTIDGKPASTKLRITPGEVPNLRLRVTPVIAKPGESITAQLIRGPEFTGQLPKQLEVHCLAYEKKVDLDAERKAVLPLAANVEGWCEVTGGGVRALVYVQPKAELEVTVQPKQPQYAPGQRAELVIQTRVGKQGGKAAVGLFGVDDSLGQLVPLPGPDAMGRVRPQVETSAPAFGALDGQALALGRIRGANAAAATVLRVTAIPKPPELDAVVSTSARSAFDPVEDLTDHFYVVLAELHAQARVWEAKAPAGEKMRPVTMASLWSKAIAACKSRGQPVTDAYGRTLRLSRLPPDLLSLTDPRAVIVVGTRLPEDVENWAQWVARERP
ncbi:MAG TPA: MG2 domain-containing protein [Kofleriaceae bacterium]|nr:MG2 domain-containing protein [Kofleriaceae bacterium]